MYSWPQRKSLRLKDYDYNQDWFYFVTVCTKDREHFFWEIQGEIMNLSEMWEIAKREIESDVRDNILIDCYIVMPNHIHAIIVIRNQAVGCDRIAPCEDITPWTKTEQTLTQDNGTMPSFPTLSRMIRWIKWRITSQIWIHCESWYLFSWQKSYYDVIIRNEEQLYKTRQYILDNPKNWNTDSNNI